MNLLPTFRALQFSAHFSLSLPSLFVLSFLSLLFFSNFSLPPVFNSLEKLSHVRSIIPKRSTFGSDTQLALGRVQTFVFECHSFTLQFYLCSLSLSLPISMFSFLLRCVHTNA